MAQSKPEKSSTAPNDVDQETMDAIIDHVGEVIDEAASEHVSHITYAISSYGADYTVDRHNIAHGRPTTVSLSRVKTWNDNTTQVILFIHELILPGY
jgi:hypothetical protein